MRISYMPGFLRMISIKGLWWMATSFMLYLLAKVMGGGEGGYAVTLAVTGYSLIPLVRFNGLPLFYGAIDNCEVPMQ